MVLAYKYNIIRYVLVYNYVYVKLYTASSLLLFPWDTEGYEHEKRGHARMAISEAARNEGGARAKKNYLN